VTVAVKQLQLETVSRLTTVCILKRIDHQTLCVDTMVIYMSF